MEAIKAGSWLDDLVQVYNDLGGTASYEDVYAHTRRRRESRGASWTAQAEASIRRTVEDHAESSANFRGRAVFFSVNGHGRGVWGVLPSYRRADGEQQENAEPAYLEGVEGIVRERRYLSRSRDPRLVEERKKIDDFTCQACRFRLSLGKDRYVIEVHHRSPIGLMKDVKVTSIDDLVCLCPTCHCVAHSNRKWPLEVEEIKGLLKSI